MDYEALLDMVILFGLAVLTVTLFRRLMLPSVIGFLATGIVAGPYALAFVKDTHEVEQMAEIGVVLLLFTIGIEFSLKELARIRHLVLWGGGVQVGFTILAVAALGNLFDYPPRQALFFGFLTALSSTAIVLKLLMDAGETDAPHGKTALGILIFQDLCVVPLMLFTPFLAGAGKGAAGIAIVTAKALAVLAIAHYGARVAVPWLFRQVVGTRSRELFILTVIFIGFGTAWITAKAGLSLALGAFIAGLAISESEYSQQVLGDIIPFRDAFMSLFFISVGMLLDPAVILRQPLVILSLVLAIVILKTVITAGATVSIGLPLRVAIVAALSLAQVGEFSFVLSHAGLKHGLLSQELYQLFLCASVGTMALTPFCLKIASPVAEYVAGMLPPSLTRGKRTLAEREKGIALSDHVIIAGFGLNGRNLAGVLKHLGIPHVVVETNPFTVSEEREKGEHIVFGDATRPEVLAHASIERARSLVIAISDAASSRRIVSQARQMNPTIHIIVRTRYLVELEPLYRLGANEVIPEEFETSVEILSRVLRSFLVPHDTIEECIAEVRKGGYEMLRSVGGRHVRAADVAGLLFGAEVMTFRVRKGSPLDGTGLREGMLRSGSGATILVIKRGEEIVPNPDPVWELREGDIVVVMGTPEQLAAAARLFEHN